jgi:hypothetical protein
MQSYISTVHHIHGYISSIALMVEAFCHYPLIALVQIGMFCNQPHLNHSDNKLWARIFQTSLISLLCYSHLLSLSFVMNVADIYYPHDCDLNSMRTWSPFSPFPRQTHPCAIYPCSSYTHLDILQWFLPSTSIFPGVIAFLPLLMGDLLLFPSESFVRISGRDSF